MRLLIAPAFAALAIVAACQSAPPASNTGLTGAERALESHYRTLPESFYPKAPAGVSLPSASQAISRILVGSCLDEELAESPAMLSIAREKADLFLMTGDNVYGDMNQKAYVNNQVELDELRASFTDLAARNDFKSVRAAFPMMVSWDDHDYGANDGGGDFAFRTLAERIHEKFWGLDKTEAGRRAGTYYAREFGPEGQRTQILMLDTRMFRSKLTPTDQFNAKGKERYIPSADPDQAMLGEAQWRWLEEELKKPADVRLIVSSIQVMTTDGHGWEAWSRLPKEQARLYRLINSTGAKGVVFVSGDRHASYMYRKDGLLPYPAHELTASSFNASFAESTTERDSAQIIEGYTKENYGAISIDWANDTIRFEIRSNSGETVRDHSFKFR